MITHELDDTSDILVEVFNTNDSHDIRSVLCIRVSASGVGHDQHRVRLRQLKNIEPLFNVNLWFAPNWYWVIWSKLLSAVLCSKLILNILLQIAIGCSLHQTDCE